MVYEGLDCAQRDQIPSGLSRRLEKEDSRILAAFAHSLGRGWGSGVFNFMGDGIQVCDGVGPPSLDALCHCGARPHCRTIGSATPANPKPKSERHVKSKFAFLIFQFLSNPLADREELHQCELRWTDASFSLAALCS